MDVSRSARDPSVIPASHCEAILRGMSKQANKDGDWIEVKFQVHPQEVPQALWDAALRSRWQLAFVEIGDDEQPVQQAPEPPRERTRSQWAGIRCSDPEFARWFGFAGGNPDFMARHLREHLGIQSRKELDSNPAKGVAWDELEAKFIEDTRLPERH